MSGLLGTKASVASDLNLFLQIIIIIIILVGARYGKAKTGQDLKSHKRLMTIAVALNAVGFIFVMGPSIVVYFSTPPVEPFTLGTVSTLLHAFFGGLAEILGIAFVLNKKPGNIRLWMRMTRWFWVIAFVLGLSLYLQLAGLI